MGMKYRFFIADVFTDRPFTGNQLAVLPDAEGLSTRAMQALAREFNFAESTFVLPPSSPEFRGEGAHLHAEGRDALRRPSRRSARQRCLRT